MSESRSDGELVSESLEDPDAFSAIFSRHFDDIFRFVARRVGRDDAAEISGDVFARAFELRHRFDTARSSARPWLYGIASNIVGDHLRHTEVHRRRFLTGAVRSAGRETDPYTGIDDAIDARSLRRAIDAGLARLSADDRDVLLLFSLGGLSYSEIAEALSIPIGTVRSRVARAKRKMRELLPGDAQTMLRVFDEGDEP